ncbi:MAG: hypothetical protein CML22_08240 [Rheinheimera sp.]|nr:hypothetical protein [Rheinheimera sp.]MBM34277.1 hypothetical protein [Rheinheimera sp.]HAW92270.1 hypothetical protein [Candidatus Azambacteria bacterium]
MSLFYCYALAILTAQQRLTDHTTLVLLLVVIATSAEIAKPSPAQQITIIGIYWHCSVALQ